MAKINLSDLLEIKPPQEQTSKSLHELQIAIETLNPEYGNIYSANGFNGQYYSFKNYTDLKSFLYTLGFPKDTPDKYFEPVISNWYQTLTQIPEYSEPTTTEVPRPTQPDATTLTSDQLNDLSESAKKRAQQKIDIEAREKQAVDDYIKQNEERIAKAKGLQEKLNNKVVYAKVIIPEPLPLDDIEKQDLQVLREYAQGNEETRTKLIDDLTKQIEVKLQNIPENQKELIARTAAVEIVGKLAKPEEAYEVQIQNSILTAIHEDKTQVLPKVLQKDDDLLATAKNGSTLLRLAHRDHDLISRTIAINIFGEKLTQAIYGPEQFEIKLSETKMERETTHNINLGNLNQNYVQELQHQNSTLNTIKDFGIDRTQSFFVGQARTYITEKMAGLPAGSVIKKAYSDPIVQSIFARYGLANPVVWQTAGNSQFVNIAMRFAPDTAGPLLNIAGRITGNEFVTPIVIVSGGAVGASFASQAVSTYTSIAITDIMAAEAFAGGVGTASQVAVKKGFAGLIGKIATFFGLPAGPVGVVVGAAIGEVVSKLIQKINWPKIKKWFQDNKEIFVMAGAGIGLMVGGPVAGLVTGGLLMATTGTLGAFAIGTFNLFGAIGRSVGITIATPVIVTLVTIPPLVAFIMLVINNSAYVVPPSFESGQGGYTPQECLGEAPLKPNAGTVKFSSDGKFAYPVGEFPSNPYGACYHWDGNKAADLFNDFVPKGPLVAYEDGSITNVTLNDSIGGKYVILRGNSGRYYYYAHLCFPYVNKDDSVKAGDVIGTMDETGSGRVQHLHFAINDSNLPLLGDTPDEFIGGDGNVCPFIDFEEKFSFGICRPETSCVTQ